MQLEVQQHRIHGGVVEVPPEVLEKLIASSGTKVIPADAEDALAEGTIEFRETGNPHKAILDPKGPDPLNLRGCEISLPPPEKAGQLQFAFGGQPVLVGPDSAADKLPVVGMSVPGGPHFNLFELLGFSLEDLKSGKLAQVTPELKARVAKLMENRPDVAAQVADHQSRDVPQSLHQMTPQGLPESLLHHLPDNVPQSLSPSTHAPTQAQASNSNNLVHQTAMGSRENPQALNWYVLPQSSAPYEAFGKVTAPNAGMPIPSKASPANAQAGPSHGYASSQHAGIPNVGLPNVGTRNLAGGEYNSSAPARGSAAKTRMSLSRMYTEPHGVSGRHSSPQHVTSRDTRRISPSSAVPEGFASLNRVGSPAPPNVMPGYGPGVYSGDPGNFGLQASYESSMPYLSTTVYPLTQADLNMLGSPRGAAFEYPTVGTEQADRAKKERRAARRKLREQKKAMICAGPFSVTALAGAAISAILGGNEPRSQSPRNLSPPRRSRSHQAARNHKSPLRVDPNAVGYPPAEAAPSRAELKHAQKLAHAHAAAQAAPHTARALTRWTEVGYGNQGPEANEDHRGRIALGVQSPDVGRVTAVDARGSGSRIFKPQILHPRVLPSMAERSRTPDPNFVGRFAGSLMHQPMDRSNDRYSHQVENFKSLDREVSIDAERSVHQTDFPMGRGPSRVQRFSLHRYSSEQRPQQPSLHLFEPPPNANAAYVPEPLGRQLAPQIFPSATGRIEQRQMFPPADEPSSQPIEYQMNQPRPVSMEQLVQAAADQQFQLAPNQQSNQQLRLADRQRQLADQQLAVGRQFAIEQLEAEQHLAANPQFTANQQFVVDQQFAAEQQRRGEHLMQPSMQFGADLLSEFSGAVNPAIPPTIPTTIDNPVINHPDFTPEAVLKIPDDILAQIHGHIGKPRATMPAPLFGSPSHEGPRASVHSAVTEEPRREAPSSMIDPDFGVDPGETEPRASHPKSQSQERSEKTKVFSVTQKDGSKRDIEKVSVCDSPSVDLIRGFLTTEETSLCRTFIQKVDADPQRPNNLVPAMGDPDSELLTTQERGLMKALVHRMAVLTDISEEDIVAVCPAILKLTAADATKSFSHVARIYLDEPREGALSDFPHLGVSTCPRAGSALVWRCRNERGIKSAKAAHSEIVPEGTVRHVLSLYIVSADLEPK